MLLKKRSIFFGTSEKFQCSEGDSEEIGSTDTVVRRLPA